MLAALDGGAGAGRNACMPPFDEPRDQGTPCSVQGPSPPGEAPAPLLEVSNLRVEYPRRGAGGRPAPFAAVDGVSFEVRRGESFGLVGESGSGKSTVCRAILRLTAARGGEIRYCGQRVDGLAGRRLHAFRRRVQVVFQDPAGSLNPRLRVETLLTEPMEVHRIGANRRERRARAAELLRSVGLPSDALRRFPHEFSGGQKQRIGIARALALEPELILCDEPVSALDVSVRAQVLNLLAELRQRLGLTYLFIAHDLAIVRRFCDRVAVMRRGRIVEQGALDDVFERPQAEYTRGLLAAIPRLAGASLAPVRQ